MHPDFHDHISSTGPVLQLLPAEPGWEAVYCSYDVDQQKVVTKRLPLACWAVVESKVVDEHRFLLIGMVRHGPKLISLTEEFDDGKTPAGEVLPIFLGYSYPNCETPWDELAEEAYRERKQKPCGKRESSKWGGYEE